MRFILFITFLTLQYTILQAQTIQKFSAEEAHAFLTETNTDSLLIIDGRSDEMFQSGCINKAINIDAYKDDLASQLDSIKKHQHLFIYCTKSTRSDSIINTLSLLGYKGEIIQMSDGLTGWKANKFELIVPEACKGKEEEETDQRNTHE